MIDYILLSENLFALLSSIVVVSFLIAYPFISKPLKKEIAYIEMLRYFSFISGNKNKKVLLSLLRNERLEMSRRIGLIKCKLLNIANSDNMVLWCLIDEIREVYLEAKKLEDNYAKVRRWTEMFEDKEEKR